MRSKKEILEAIAGTCTFKTTDGAVEMDFAPSALELAQLEVAIDIRDQLGLLNKRLPNTRPVGTPVSAQPPLCTSGGNR